MTKTYLRDLAERVLTSFVFGAVSVLGADAADLTDISLWKAAVVGGGAAVLSLVKGLLARKSGDPESAGI